jgi:ubiquinone/menaquinone biosynthesis C-methylase UbiE
MGFYGKRVLPRLVHLACGLKPFTRQREKVVPLARGCVLEVGLGSGLNLPHYVPGEVTAVWGMDPSAELLAMALERAREAGFPVGLINGSAESIPLPADSVDTVVVTYTLCTIPQVDAALAEMRRVLRPKGTLLFCEHGAAPDPSVRRWQDRLTPAWKRVAGGCHLNRDIPALLARSGFRIEALHMTYLPGWRPATFNFWGSAKPQ